MRLTKSSTNTCRLGICKSPSNIMGNDAPAASAAGIITNHVVLGPKVYSRDCVGPHCASFPTFAFELELPYSTILYATKIARNEWHAIVRAEDH
jgi:hypothetical protein